MAEWEGLLIVLTFTFVIAGAICRMVYSAQYQKVESNAKRWRMAGNIFFTLFFASFILTFIAHTSR